MYRYDTTDMLSVPLRDSIVSGGASSGRVAPRRIGMDEYGGGR
jgi:hypothetical protein